MPWCRCPCWGGVATSPSTTEFFGVASRCSGSYGEDLAKIRALTGYDFDVDLYREQNPDPIRCNLPVVKMREWNGTAEMMPGMIRLLQRHPDGLYLADSLADVDPVNPDKGIICSFSSAGVSSRLSKLDYLNNNREKFVIFGLLTDPTSADHPRCQDSCRVTDFVEILNRGRGN